MPGSSPSRKVRGSLILLATAVLWGSSFVVVKNTVNLFPPSYLIGIRFLIGFAFLCVLLRKKLREIRPGLFRGGLLIGLLLLGAYELQTLGIVYTTPGRNAFLTGIYVVVVPFLAWAVLRKRPDRYNAAAALLCIAGIGFISLDGTAGMSSGDMLSLASGFLFAAQIVAIAKYAAEYDPGLLCLLEMGVCAAGGFAAGAFTETFPAQAPPAEAVISLLYLGIVISALCQLWQNIGLTEVSASTASLLLSLESVFGVLFSILLYGERLTVQVAVGFALVFLAIVVGETKLSFVKGRPRS